MIILQANNLTKRFNGETLFKNINLTISEKSHIGLVGQNGAGKSTILKMLIGIEAVSEGTITKKKNLSIGYLPQNTGLHSDKSILDEMETAFADLIKEEQKLHKLEVEISNQATIENPKKLAEVSKSYDELQADFTRRNGYGYKAEIRTVLSGFGFKEIDFNRKINELSGGQQTRLAIAKLLLEKPQLLVLDEPTNHIDMETTDWLENYLQAYNGALLIISHDRYFMDKVVNEIYNLDNGKIDYYKGNYSNFTKEKIHRQSIAEKDFEKQQKKIKKEEEFVKKNIVRASTTKRAQSRQKQLDKMEVLNKPSHTHKTAKFRFNPERKSGNVVLDVDNLAIGYQDQVLSYPINIHLKRYQRMAVFGPNGIGKSTLLKTILGQLPKIKGTVQFGTGVSIGYYDQQQASLHPQKDVLHELWDDYPTTPEGEIRSILGSFLFSGNDVEKSVANLSGGEKARLLLTKLSMNRDNFLILDEPTNHLDIESINVLEKALLQFQGTILFVSHDRYFINKLATHILELSPNGSKVYIGNYDYYKAKKNEEQEISEHEQQKKSDITKQVSNLTETKQRYQDKKTQQREIRKLKRNIADLETQLNQIEIDKKELEKQMTLPENYNDRTKSQDLQTQLEKINHQQEQAETAWENANLKLEEIN
ncbi:ABC-F family ATP-binding cassette domain-containing protein [Fructilactobacillus lindneri]|uniref:ABC-F family ATP-binding cassette domain-containing protein n=1 Tax=Fructilactobacillus lindneri TaxID=53444 RepID=UPI0009D633B4|nr:ABC-F family ATP-binding cassette domain-containing protein [Fructilactobacillus lindneri]SJZ69876.1 ATP-binding cassette, subfamily F, member 3 [Fructilactobacillus lindneri DSM 20690 = JCM 11027]